jgi:hypothetical protein
MLDSTDAGIGFGSGGLKNGEVTLTMSSLGN